MPTASRKCLRECIVRAALPGPMPRRDFPPETRLLSGAGRMRTHPVARGDSTRCFARNMPVSKRLILTTPAPGTGAIRTIDRAAGRGMHCRARRHAAGRRAARGPQGITRKTGALVIGDSRLTIPEAEPRVCPEPLRLFSISAGSYAHFYFSVAMVELLESWSSTFDWL